MVYVDLPELGLEGDWAVTDAERALARRIVPLLPAEPAPGADMATRWSALQSTLNTLIDVIRTEGSGLFEERGGSHTSQPGTITMIEMPFTLARWFNEVGQRHQLATSMKGVAGGNAVLADLTAEVEPEVAELRRLLTAAAGT
ncbi:hypothetical protein [Kibdelosporangium aridum]|uniref:hypothetical protein n=1 Tax=Kibdelosporangium aridum TaxID=2030 RepID=UPI000525EFF8